MQSGEVSAKLEMCLSVSRASGGQTVLMLAIHSDKKNRKLAREWKGKGLYLALLGASGKMGKFCVWPGHRSTQESSCILNQS